MTWAPASPVTGAAMTGLTSPTYTLVADSPPVPHSKQYTVSALGGTQTGVVVGSVSRPFTISFFKPALLKQLPPLNNVTGQLSSVPVNVYKQITRKSVLPLAGQPGRTMVITTTVEMPAGSDVADAVNALAGLSLHIGALWEQSNEIGDTIQTGVM